MTSILARPSPQALFNSELDRVSVDILGGSPVIPESNEWYVASLNYAVTEEFYSIAEQMWRERDPRYACSEALIAMAARDGVFPRPAEYTQGFATLTGTPGSNLQGGIIVSLDGVNYRAVGTIPDTLSDDGNITLRFASVDPGPEKNAAPKGTVGTLITPLDGIDSEVTADSGFCGGTEAETLTQFRTRYLERLQYKPSSRMTDIMNMALAYPCVTRVCVRPEACCPDPATDPCCNNRIELYALFDNSFPCGTAPQSVVDDMTGVIFGTPAGFGLGWADIGVCGKFYTATPAIVNIEATELPCVTAVQEREVRDRMADFFTNICPSSGLTVRQVFSVIAQVLGDANSNFIVTLTSEDENVTIDPECGDASVPCDYLICLGTFTMTNNPACVL